MSHSSAVKRHRSAGGAVCRAKRALDFGPTDPKVAALVPDLLPNKEEEPKRPVFTRKQRVRLERAFRDTRYLSTPVKMELTQQLGVPPKQIQAWFRTRRARSDAEQQRYRFVASLPLETPQAQTPSATCGGNSTDPRSPKFATTAELQDWPVPPTPDFCTGAEETVAMVPPVPAHFPDDATWSDHKVPRVSSATCLGSRAKLRYKLRRPGVMDYLLREE